MRRCASIVVLSMLGAAVGLAQVNREIQWQRDVPAAVARSQQTRLPLMFWILGSSGDRDNNLENDQRRAFQDPRVLRLSQRFVAARLSRSVNRDLLEELGLPARANLEIAFVTPDGKVIDRLAPSGVAKASTLAEKMKLVFDAYRRQMLSGELQPVLENQEAGADELRGALERIRDFHVTAADAALVKLLERKGLDRKIVRLCYEVLASLSTPTSLDKLLELSADGDVQATDALPLCTPVGAEHILDKLVTEDGRIRLDVYDAVVRSCNIKNRKSAKWWERVKDSLLRKEIERVKGLAKVAAQRWKAENDE